jgi:Raf kinase inhibitor-like YbhB/YbcL family protein
MSAGSSATPPSASPTGTPGTTPTPGPFTLTSSAFAEGEPIPRAQTCDGADRSPPLAWTGAPAGASVLVLVVDDPDARDFVHWLVVDLPAKPTGSLPRGIAAGTSPPQQGRNDFGRVGWGGPCPPSGTHHYRFTLSALAAPLGLDGHPDGSAVRQALRDATIVGRASLTGTYHR